MSFIVKTRYGNYRIKGKKVDFLENENMVYIQTEVGPVAIYGWTMVIPEEALKFVEEIKEEKQEWEDYQQVTPEKARELRNEGYVYTGETWRGLVGVAKYKEREEDHP